MMDELFSISDYKTRINFHGCLHLSNILPGCESHDSLSIVSSHLPFSFARCCLLPKSVPAASNPVRCNTSLLVVVWS